MARDLRTVHDWVKMYERMWRHQLLRIKDRAEKMDRQDLPEERKPESRPS